MNHILTGRDYPRTNNNSRDWVLKKMIWTIMLLFIDDMPVITPFLEYVEYRGNLIVKE
jgi:hypothetical protein